MVHPQDAIGLVAVDWGSSSLRAARIDTDGRVVEQRAWPSSGILHVQPQGSGPAARAAGFARLWRDTVGGWLDAHPSALCLMAGMVGSQQGWREAPYTPCPASLPDIAQHRCWLSQADGIAHGQRVAIVGGLRCEHDGVPDVMRGEETQVLGACALLGLHDATVILPGTHSKWVDLRAGRIEGFRTWMSGEFYAMLRQHSILARTLPSPHDGGHDSAPGTAHGPAFDEAAFSEGVLHAQRARSLLASAFSVRALSLFDRMPLQARAAYLSGLVIGEELRAALQLPRSGPMVLVGDAQLVARYQSALKLCNIDAHALDAQATWRGLWQIAQLAHPAH